ncbi:hypothetical protein CDL12_12505 [Handroanthus impetiginosus]|uniref:Germin-like protein n=1 Tax=Handroanthus impetiginosus TaxID=429701 RepID=A0A2G9HBF0_9LAMI|nr:hypothetical protein CDL12_12505 [Handroanthus impetiginosus]
MPSNSTPNFLPILLLFTFITSIQSDPDIISDYITPSNFTIINSTFFTYTGLRTPFHSNPPTFTVTKATLTEFPALNGQSLLFLISGTLEVAFVDNKNAIYEQKLRTGDMFIFPKGLVHYQYNRNHENPAVAISAFGSANAGTVSIPNSVFGSGIDDGILAKAFKTDVATIQRIKSGFITNP